MAWGSRYDHSGTSFFIFTILDFGRCALVLPAKFHIVCTKNHPPLLARSPSRSPLGRSLAPLARSPNRSLAPFRARSLAPRLLAKSLVRSLARGEREREGERDLAAARSSRRLPGPEGAERSAGRPRSPAEGRWSSAPQVA